MTTADTKAGLSTWCRFGDHSGCNRIGAPCGCSCHRAPVARETVVPPVPLVAHEAPQIPPTPARAPRQARTPRPPAVRKQDAACCQAARDADELLRWPVGYCSPECVRRPTVGTGRVDLERAVDDVPVVGDML